MPDDDRTEPDIELQAEHRFGTPRRGAKEKAIASARVLTGVLGVAVGAAAIVAAALVPLPKVTAEPAAVTVAPVSAGERVVCPGAVLRLGDESGQNASSAAPLGAPSSISSGAGVAGAFLQTPDAGNTETGAPLLLFAPDSTGNGAGIAGAQSQAVDSGDYRGFAAAGCARPTSDLWLAGSSTALGRTTLLTLANPGAVVSSVSIEIFGESGVVDAPGTKGIVLAPNSQRVLSLAGFAPSLASIVVHVTSSGGPILANLQQSIVRGIEPGGVDIIGATAEPSTLNVIPGLVILNSEALQARLGEEGFDDLSTALRVFVPGSVDGSATVRVVPETSGADGASFELDLSAGVVTDIALEGLSDGSFSVILSSDVPAIASLRASTVSTSRGGATDVAWFVSATELPGTAVVSVAPGPAAAIHLSNTGDAAALVTATGSDGSVVTVEIQGGSAAALAVTGGVSYSLSSPGSIYGSVSYAGPWQLASYLIGGAAAAQPVVVVYPG